MIEDELTAERIDLVTSYVDVEAPPPGIPAVHLIFGTNQALPAAVAADRYYRGLAPLIVATGGVNRRNGVIEGREFHRLLLELGVPEAAIRHEDSSTNTWQNVEFGLPYLREAVRSGLPVAAVCKWYHRRALHVLRTLLPDVDAFYAVTWAPVYAGTPVTRSNWPHHPDGRHRVLREWREVHRRVADGGFKDVRLVDGAWR